MYTHTTHITLLRRLAAPHDGDAWTEFCERYGELIRRFARRRGLQEADCDDVLQDVLSSLCSAMPGFEYDPHKGLFRSYLKTVVANAVQRKRRLQARGEAPPIADELDAGADEIEQIWESEWRQYHLRLARRAIEPEFPEHDWQAFDLYVAGGRGAQETAEALDLSREQVYQAKSRIMRRLSETIAENVDEEG